MSIGKDFTFTQKLEIGRLYTPSVCKAAKDYKGACEYCSSDIHKGTFVLTSEEVLPSFDGLGDLLVKTHRLCASCTADYIKATSVQTPEPTYAERQAEWVKENNVKKGTKVRVIRTFTSGEDGCNIPFTPVKGTFIGDDCTVDVVREHDACIRVRSKQKDDWWYFPYFVLEVIKEPTYRPYNSEELNDLVGKIVVRKCDGNKMLVIERINPMKVGLGNGWAYTAEQLLELFTLNGKPCGIKEEV